MNRSKIIICDVDGTVAQATNRSFYDYTKALQDAPLEHVIKIIQGLDSQGYKNCLHYWKGRKCI